MDFLSPFPYVGAIISTTFYQRLGNLPVFFLLFFEGTFGILSFTTNIGALKLSLVEIKGHSGARVTFIVVKKESLSL